MTPVALVFEMKGSKIAEERRIEADFQKAQRLARAKKVARSVKRGESSSSASNLTLDELAKRRSVRK